MFRVMLDYICLDSIRLQALCHIIDIRRLHAFILGGVATIHLPLAVPLLLSCVVTLVLPYVAIVGNGGKNRRRYHISVRDLSRRMNARRAHST